MSPVPGASRVCSTSRRGLRAAALVPRISRINTMSLRYRNRLLDHLQHRNYTPRKIEQLAQELGIDDQVEFGEAVQALAGEGVIEVSDAGLITLPSLAGQQEMEVIFKKNPRGFGFVIPD